MPKFIDAHPMNPLTAEQLRAAQMSPPDDVGIEDVLVRRMFFDVDVACGPVRLLPRGRIPERHKEASILVVMTELWNRLVCGEALLRPINLELEDSNSNHVTGDALRGRQDDALRIRISHQPG